MNCSQWLCRLSVPVVTYSLSNCNCVLYTSGNKTAQSWDFLNTCFFSPLLLSPSTIPHPCPLPLFASLRSLPGPPCHSPIALRPLFCNSCRLQLCTSFLCSLLVRYRYRFSLCLSLQHSVSLSLFLLSC